MLWPQSSRCHFSQLIGENQSQGYLITRRPGSAILLCAQEAEARKDSNSINDHHRKKVEISVAMVLTHMGVRTQLSVLAVGLERSRSCRQHFRSSVRISCCGLQREDKSDQKFKNLDDFLKQGLHYLNRNMKSKSQLWRSWHFRYIHLRCFCVWLDDAISSIIE